LFRLDLFFVCLLLLAECYAFLELYLGFFQTSWLLHRKPMPLPEDVAEWPAVDVYIPTYNEPLELVRRTALAAINIDWPADRFHVYILDDGNREAFRLFAAEVGCGYLARPVHSHAKAGNINYAMQQTQGKFIAIFDSDHIPCRSFLQMTVGWFLKDSRLGLLQTPHHFYSPDPFERNLDQFRQIPNEGELFYGLVQDGNDFWNATFFCGSCAVIRRPALEEIGGVAVETVTEDAHTSLRIQRNGWNTAYLNIPQAAGLATESLSSHIGQRIRWARGMIQILRTDNPLFGKGLKFPQRLCYFNAMMHFLYAVPRLIFLTSPLVYLLLGRSNFFGFWLTIAMYAFPHILLSNLTNSRIQGEFRFSFWNEIYETVLAPYILLPTLVALVNPKRGKFNVTAKGGLVADSYFDRRIAVPYLVLLGLNILGVLVAIPRYFIWNVDRPGTVILNTIWTLYNIMILSVATAVALESQQRRADVRVEVESGFTLLAANGQAIHGSTIDMSNSGLRVELYDPCPLKANDAVKFTSAPGTGDSGFSGTIVSRKDLEIRIKLDPLTLFQEEALTRVIYSRADTWLTWRDNRGIDRPLNSLLLIGIVACKGLGMAARELFSKGAGPPEEAPEKTPMAAKSVSVAGGSLSLWILGALLLLPFGRGAARPKPADAKTAEASAVTAQRSAAAGEFEEVYDLAALGHPKPVLLRGADGVFRLDFGIPITKVVSDATLLLRYRAAPELVASESHIELLLNGVEVQTIPIVQSGTGAAAEVRVTLPAELLGSDNELVFDLKGRLSREAADAQSPILTRIERSTQIQLAGKLLPLANDLGLFPAPFFDRSNSRPVVLPVVFASRPSLQMIEAAGIVASYVGDLADYRGAHFPVSTGSYRAGNLVYFLDRSSGTPAELDLENLHGPAIAMRNNPGDRAGKVLVVMGDNGDELVTAARALSLLQFVRAGDASAITDFHMPGPMAEGSAPRWLHTNRISPLASYASPEQLQVYGTGTVEIYFRVPPDLHFGTQETVPLQLKYKYRGVSSGRKGSITVKLNGTYVASIELPPEGQNETDVLTRTLPVNVLALSRFGNTLTFDFSFGNDNQSPANIANLYGAILKDSTLDLRGIPGFAEMPNLNLFAEAGYPFTRYPDLSHTAVVLPREPTAEQISLALAMLASMGARTGSAGIRVAVADAERVGEVRDRDLLVIGSGGDQRLFRDWPLPVQVEGDGFQLAEVRSLPERVKLWLHRGYGSGRQQLAEVLGAANPPESGVMEMESPGQRGRTAVLLASINPNEVGDIVGHANARA
jgi:cellulose synthase (UDP-forming)